VEISEDIVSIRACGCLVRNLIVTREENDASQLAASERRSSFGEAARSRCSSRQRLSFAKGNEITSYIPLAAGTSSPVFSNDESYIS